MSSFEQAKSDIDINEQLAVLQGQFVQVPPAFQQRLPFLARLTPEVLASFDEDQTILLSELLDSYTHGLNFLLELYSVLAQSGIDLATEQNLTVVDYAKIYSEFAEGCKPSLAELLQVISVFLKSARYQQPDVSLDVISKKIIRHDVSKHIIPYLHGLQLAMHGVNKAAALYHSNMIKSASSPANMIKFCGIVDDIINYINYYSTMVGLELGIPVDDQLLISSLPSYADVKVVMGEFCNSITPEAYTAIRTVILNGAQYLRSAEEIPEPHIEVSIMPNLDAQAVTWIMNYGDGEPDVYVNYKLARDAAVEQGYVLFNIANMATPHAAERLKQEFEHYLTQTVVIHPRGSREEAESSYTAEHGMQLAHYMVVAGQEIIGERKVSGLGLKISPMAGTDNVQVNMMLACPLHLK